MSANSRNLLKRCDVMPSLLEFLDVFCKKFNVENELKCYNIETNAYIIVLYANMLFLAFYSFLTYPVHYLFNFPYCCGFITSKASKALAIMKMKEKIFARGLVKSKRGFKHRLTKVASFYM